MKPRWRWAIAAGVAVFLAVVLYFRLDTGRMQKALPPLVFRLTHANIKFDHLSFSAIHGLDVRLDNVRMSHTFWQIKAPTVLLELRVIPLLLGKIDLQGIYLISPIIRIAPQEAKRAPGMGIHGLPRDLMLDDLSVSDATLISDRDQTWISGLDMDIQDIGPSRTVRWELQARTGEQTAVGHGQLSLRLGTIYSGFAKLSLERIPLQAFRSISRISDLTNHFLSHGYKQLSSVMTMDIGHDDQWTIFGETTLSGGTGRPSIKLRGRLYRDTNHSLGWRDSFIRVGDDAKLAVEGGCTEDDVCETSIRGKSFHLAALASATAPTTPTWQPISGNMDVDANLSWRKKDWKLTGRAEMQDMMWQNASSKLAMPDFHIDDLLISGQHLGFTLKSSRIGFIKRSGNLLASGRYNLERHAGKLLLRFDALQDAWVPVLQLTSMIYPSVSTPITGQGVMQGSATLAIADDKPKLHFSLDGTKAKILMSGANKPVGVVALASGNWRTGNIETHLEITSATLGTSTLKGLLWQRTKTHRILRVNQINLDMQRLRKQGVQFPTFLKSYQGVLAGNLTTAWDQPVSSESPPFVWPGLPNLTAHLDLARFGTRNWQLQGHVVFDRGSSQLHKLLLTGAHGNADLDGDISFVRMLGHIDVHQGTLNWDSGNTLPTWLTAIRLHGRIAGLDVSWLGQNWKNLEGRYRLDGHHLHIPSLKSALAGGNVSFRDLSLDFEPGTLALRGFAQLGSIQTQNLPGLANSLQSQLNGKAFATIKFDGTLPFKGWQAWRNDGNIMIYSGSWRPNPLKGVVQVIHRFDQLGFRFRNRHGRVSISRIVFRNTSGHYTGNAVMNSTGILQGKLIRRKDSTGFILGGAWPHITWKNVSGAPTH